MEKIGIFFGSDTGNTESIAKMIQKNLGKKNSKIFDISESTKNDIEKYNFLIFGIPTWYYGEIQCDWNNFIPILKKIDFKNKIVAFFGCGDQEDYSEYFCDALKPIFDIVKKNNGNIIGKWPITGYKFKSSKSLIDSKNFLGLIIDEDRQSEKTEERIKEWVLNISSEFNKKKI
ncbi:flavodoxin FldA [Buchnera aphidicola (Kurisakia onigurumii)]|uniref:flavodoxin FldA n=1 Tax=Buchnera aphidicola TaxID=9 RepID=UPI0031B6F089